VTVQRTSDGQQHGGVPDEAEDLKAQLYGLLPRIRITDLLAEVAVWTRFGDRFTHVRSGEPPQDERSLFMLDWLDDINLRRRTNANLNKGEARNALARAVFFNRLGELRDRTFENQRHRASGLNLVSAAITFGLT